MHVLNRSDLKLVNQYIIPFKGLKEGEHEFQFFFDKRFFDEHEVLEALDGDIVANVLLIKRPSLLQLDIIIKGTLEILCDRCLEYFSLPLYYSGELIVKFSEHPGVNTDDEILVLHPNEHKLNLHHYFLDCIALSLPLQRVHADREDGEPGCNPDMLKQIRDHAHQSSKNREEIDPRWSKLKNLLNDIN